MADTKQATVVEKTPESLKAAFIKELNKKQCFCDGFSHKFVFAIDAVNFWTFCGLHYPYRVITFIETDNRISFEREFAMAILHDLTQAAPGREGSETEAERKLDNDENIRLKTMFMKELANKQLSCTEFSFLFSTVKLAIGFWTACRLSHPYSLVEKEGKFQIQFWKTVGGSILSALRQAEPQATVVVAEDVKPEAKPTSSETKRDCDDVAQPKVFSKNDLSLKKLCELKQQCLQELEAYVWKGEEFECCVFSPKFTTRNVCLFFATFCDIKTWVSFSTNCITVVNQLRCPKDAAETVKAKLQIQEDRLNAKQLGELRQKLLDEITSATVVFTFSHKFKSLSQAIVFVDFCDIKDDVLYSDMGTVQLMLKEETPLKVIREKLCAEKKQTDTNWQVVRDWFMTADKEQIMEMFSGLANS